MIIGIGHDVADLERIRSILQGAARDRFIQRVLTAAEREFVVPLLDAGGGSPAGRAVQYVAGRFAAKEAVVKALGCGVGRVAGFQDVEILPDEHGKPHCRLSERTMRRLGWSDDGRIVHVTITHAGGIASAVAVVECRRAISS